MTVIERTEHGHSLAPLDQIFAELAFSRLYCACARFHVPLFAQRIVDLDFEGVS